MAAEDEYIRKELARLADAYSSLARDIHHLDEKFLPRREWVESRKADQAMVANLNQDIGELRSSRNADAGFRRQVWLTMGALAISTMVTIVIAIANFVSK